MMIVVQLGGAWSAIVLFLVAALSAIRQAEV